MNIVFNYPIYFINPYISIYKDLLFDFIGNNDETKDFENKKMVK